MVWNYYKILESVSTVLSGVLAMLACFFGCSIFLEFMNVSQEAPTLCVLPPPFNFDKFLVFWKSDFVVSRAVHTLRFDYSVLPKF